MSRDKQTLHREAGLQLVQGRDEERDFLDVVIYTERPLPSPLAENYELARQLALGRNDWPRYFKYCGDCLRSYPNGIYTTTAERNRENAAKVLMRRNEETL